MFLLPEARGGFCELLTLSKSSDHAVCHVVLNPAFSFSSGVFSVRELYGEEGMLRSSRELNAGEQVDTLIRKDACSRPSTTSCAFPPRSIGIKQPTVNASMVPLELQGNTLVCCEIHMANSVPEPAMVKASFQRLTSDCPSAVR